MVWVLSVSQQRPDTISYEPLSMPSVSGSIFSVLSALGIIAFAFRGHNLVLEIQLMYPCGEELKHSTFTTFLLATAFLLVALRLANKPNQQALFNLGQIRFRSPFQLCLVFSLALLSLPCLASPVCSVDLHFRSRLRILSSRGS
uniref:Uncharacterized protein n=1 Tax=Brassica oleracea TaxID=3712 RepID=A0A3P6GNE3_BRAOL|nr:unnamed protein product [Brassica oleracea]